MKRGRIRARDGYIRSKFGDAETSSLVFTQIWEKDRYWFSVVEAEDGTVYDPSRLFRNGDPCVFEEFGPVVQRLLGAKCVNAWKYHSTLVDFYAREPYRRLDPTETRPFSDCLLFPLLDRIGVFKTRTAFRQGRLYASEDIPEGEIVAAFPVVALGSFTPFLREIVFQSDVYKMHDLDEDAVGLVDLSVSALVNNCINITIEKEDYLPVYAVSFDHGDSTLYIANRIRCEATRGNAVRVIFRRDSGEALHAVVVSTEHIRAGEEVYMMHDMHTLKSVHYVKQESNLINVAPMQSVYAFSKRSTMVGSEVTKLVV